FESLRGILPWSWSFPLITAAVAVILLPAPDGQLPLNWKFYIHKGRMGGPALAYDDGQARIRITGNPVTEIQILDPVRPQILLEGGLRIGTASRPGGRALWLEYQPPIDPGVSKQKVRHVAVLTKT